MPCQEASSEERIRTQTRNLLPISGRRGLEYPGQAVWVSVHSQRQPYRARGDRGRHLPSPERRVESSAQPVPSTHPTRRLRAAPAGCQSVQYPRYFIAQADDISMPTVVIF